MATSTLFPGLSRPAPTTFPLDRYRLGMALFILSESTFFTFLILAYVILHRNVPPGAPTAASSLHIGITSIFTVCLIASSFTLHIAERFLHRVYPDRPDEDQPVAGRLLNSFKAFAWLLITILLGLAFLIGQAREYTDLYRHNVNVGRDLFATSFFTLTGFHGFHVLIGLCALVGVTLLHLFGDYRRIPRVALEAFAWYWHFVDVVWIVLFSIIYLRVIP